ncbi:hypothetical protein ACTSKR_14700 [Chitinibacteraceae bacterium HSL-7]
MKELFATYPLAAWSLVSTLLALVIVVALWEKVKWWAHNTWYKFPLIGKLASLARDTGTVDETTGFAKAERVLCEDYRSFMQVQDEHDFNERKAYLRKAGESSRKDMPGWMWLLIAVMVFVEAMGFSYVLAGFTIPGASENVQQYGAYGIAFLVSVLLVGFTHWAGHELYVSNKIKNARRDWDEDGRDPKPDLVTEKITLDMTQARDDGLPLYTQQMNRFEGRRAGYLVTAITAALIVLVAVGATYVRGQVLEKQLLQETMMTGTAGAQTSDAFDMGADLVVPDADAQAGAAAEKLGREQTQSADRHGGWGTFIVLAFIFVFLQIFGILLGFKYGFASEHGRAAWRSTRRFERYADARAFYDEIADAAQAMLENLQQRRKRSASKHGVTAQRKAHATFRQYLALKREELAGDRQHDKSITQSMARIEQQASIAPVAAHITQQAQTAQSGATSQADEAVVRVVERYFALQESEREDFIADLPEAEFDAVIAAIEMRQTQQDDAAQRKAERMARLKQAQGQA